MFRKCCVSNCNSLRQDVNLHKIPANEEMKSQWLMCLSGCIDSTSVSSNMHVCHNHFERRFVNARTNHLKTGAYPTLFSDLEISSGYPSNVRVTDANVPSEGQFVPVASSNIAQLTVAELVEPSSSSLTEINTFASTSSQEATTGLVCKTPRKLVKKRLIRNAKTLTPKCRLLYKHYMKVRNKKIYNERVKKALAFSKKTAFEEVTKNMNALARKIKGWDSKRKLCNLLFDEMALETALTFMENKDDIYANESFEQIQEKVEK
ncbi:hypothetical protein ACJJTC_007434 [Scirpophaga incertulas]